MIASIRRVCIVRLCLIRLIPPLNLLNLGAVNLGCSLIRRHAVHVQLPRLFLILINAQRIVALGKGLKDVFGLGEIKLELAIDCLLGGIPHGLRVCVDFDFLLFEPVDFLVVRIDPNNTHGNLIRRDLARRVAILFARSLVVRIKHLRLDLRGRRFRLLGFRRLDAAFYGVALSSALARSASWGRLLRFLATLLGTCLVALRLGLLRSGSGFHGAIK